MSQPSTTTTTTTTTTGAPAAAVAAAAGAGESNAKRLKVEGDAAKDDQKEIDLPLPTLNKILKVVLPDATTSKEAKTGFQKAAGIFVMYVTACANDIAKENKRSTIQPSDVLAAMKELSFEAFVPALEDVIEEQKVLAQKRKASRVPRKSTAGGGGAGAADASGDAGDDGQQGGDELGEEDE